MGRQTKFPAAPEGEAKPSGAQEPELMNKLRCIGGKLRMNLNDAAVLNPEHFNMDGVMQLVAEWDAAVKEVVEKVIMRPPAEAQEGATLRDLVLTHSETLWSAVSKLESHICRNPDLPAYCKEVTSKAFEALCEINEAARSLPQALDAGGVSSNAGHFGRFCQARSDAPLLSASKEEEGNGNYSNVC